MNKRRRHTAKQRARAQKRIVAETQRRLRNLVPVSRARTAMDRAIAAELALDRCVAEESAALTEYRAAKGDFRSEYSEEKDLRYGAAIIRLQQAKQETIFARNRASVYRAQYEREFGSAG